VRGGEPKLTHFALPDGYTQDFDAMTYDGGTIIPHGLPPNWRLVFCRSATNALPGDLAWTSEEKSEPSAPVASVASVASFSPHELVDPDEPGPEDEDHRALRELLQSHATQFPLVEANTDIAWAHYQIAALNRTPVVHNGKYYDAIRFRWPETGGKFIWSMARPDRPLSWYIIPVNGRMRGFEGSRSRWLTADVDGVGKTETEVVFQELRTVGFEPGKEYLLWFSFDDKKPADIPVSLNVMADDTATVPRLFNRIFGDRIQTLDVVRL